MPGNRKETMDVREMLRRLQKGQSDRAIAKAMRVNRKTVGRYRAWATEQALLEEPLPSLGDLQRLLDETMMSPPPPQNTSTVEPYRELVVKLREQKVEIAAIYERLKEREYCGSYASVYRFVRSLEPREPEVTVRVETPPGEEAQVDFGHAGLMIDPETGKLRKTWAFVMTLSWSRHQYVEFVFDQKVETWLRLHRNALTWFGGVPRRIVIDNLKAAIVRAVWDDPEVQQSYRECAEHYGFLIAPCRPRTPQHKGKVEKGGVHYVKRNFLGGREPTTITQANRDVLVWCDTTAGLRRHGTTKEQPLARFQETERVRLRPLPETPYDMAVWKKIKVQRDCYVEFDQAYYSVPHRLITQDVWACGGIQQVRIYTTTHQLVATHERAQSPGERLTHLDHLPPDKVPGLILNREDCLAKAMEIGPATLEVVQTLLDDDVADRLPTAGRITRLCETFSAQRLEAACRRALHFDDPAYRTIKRILRQGLEDAPLPDPVSTPAATTFARPTDELVGGLIDGASWN